MLRSFVPYNVARMIHDESTRQETNNVEYR